MKSSIHNVEIKSEGMELVATLKGPDGKAITIGSTNLHSFEQEVNESVFDSSLPKARKDSLTNIQNLLILLALEVTRSQIIGEMIENKETEHALIPVEEPVFTLCLAGGARPQLARNQKP